MMALHRFARAAIVCGLMCGIASEGRAQTHDTWQVATLDRCGGDPAVHNPSSAALLAPDELVVAVCRDNAEYDPSNVDISRVSAHVARRMGRRVEMQVGVALWAGVDVDADVPARQAQVAWGVFNRSWQQGFGALVASSKFAFIDNDAGALSMRLATNIPMRANAISGRFALAGDVLGSKRLGPMVVDGSVGVSSDGARSAWRSVARLIAPVSSRVSLELSFANLTPSRAPTQAEVTVGPILHLTSNLSFKPVLSLWAAGPRIDLDYRGMIGHRRERQPRYFPPLEPSDRGK